MEHSLSPFKYRISKMQSIFIKINANLPARAQVTLAVGSRNEIFLVVFCSACKGILGVLKFIFKHVPQHSIVMIFLLCYENFIEYNI